MPLTGDDISRLFDAHAGELLAFFVARTLAPEASVDLLGETFASAFCARDQFRGGRPQAERAWLYGIARNLVTDYFRHGEVERRALASLGVEPQPLTDAEHDYIERRLAATGVRELLLRELAALPQDQRQALLLRVIEEQSYPDVASSLGISEPTARARVSRALRALRDSPSLVGVRDSLDYA